MREIQATIEGANPLLEHNPAGMVQKGPKTGGIPTAEDEAKAGRYLLPDGSGICFPADNVKRAVVDVAPGYAPKEKKKLKLTAFVAGSTEFVPEMIPLLIPNGDGWKPADPDEYVIDTRSAVVQRARILRSRPKFNQWRLSFSILVDDDFPVSDLSVFREMLEEAGRRRGIGDFRPACKGRFGKFKVIAFKVL